MTWRVFPFGLASTAVAAGLLSPCPRSETDADLVREGRAAWAKPDSEGRACNSCHSPQGLEIAFYNFDDGDILRRAEPHLSPAEAQEIVGMMHARRREHHVYKPFDAMLDLPLQPGGQVLPGGTPEDTDAAFALEIDRMLPLLTRGSVDSVQKAREVARQVLAVDLRRLKVGFRFNRLSEDTFHGGEHASLADWIPDTPVKLPPEAIEARDAFARDPSDGNLKALLTHVPRIPSDRTVAGGLALAKYRALIHLSAQLANPSRDELGPQIDFENPYWDVAEIARESRGFPVAQLGLPADVGSKKQGGPLISEQFESMELPWYWMGWMADPGLQHTGISRKARTGLYFGFELLNRGPYPMHCAFMFLRKQLSQAFDPRAWTRSSPQHFVLEYSSFLANDNFRRFAPKRTATAQIYAKFVLNSFRASLLLMLDDTEKKQISDLQGPALDEARQMADYIESANPTTKKSIESVLHQIKVAFQQAKELRG